VLDQEKIASPTSVWLEDGLREVYEFQATLGKHMAVFGASKTLWVWLFFGDEEG